MRYVAVLIAQGYYREHFNKEYLRAVLREITQNDNFKRSENVLAKFLV